MMSVISFPIKNYLDGEKKYIKHPQSLGGLPSAQSNALPKRAINH